MDVPAASVCLARNEGEGNMRLLLVLAARVNFNVCLVVMARTGAVSGVGEKHTTVLPLQ